MKLVFGNVSDNLKRFRKRFRKFSGFESMTFIAFNVKITSSNLKLNLLAVYDNN